MLRAWSARDATHSRVAGAGSGAGRAGGPELCGATAGRLAGDGRSAGGVEGGQGGVDLAGGLVVAQHAADLAAGQPAGMILEEVVDLLSERLSGRAGQRPGGGPVGVVVERERGREVCDADVVLAVGEGVDEREADDVRLARAVIWPIIPSAGWLASCR